jgi:hypothetical protein
VLKILTNATKHYMNYEGQVLNHWISQQEIQRIFKIIKTSKHFNLSKCESCDYENAERRECKTQWTCSYIHYNLGAAEEEYGTNTFEDKKNFYLLLKQQGSFTNQFNQLHLHRLVFYLNRSETKLIMTVKAGTPGTGRAGIPSQLVWNKRRRRRSRRRLHIGGRSTATCAVKEATKTIEGQIEDRERLGQRSRRNRSESSSQRSKERK